MSELVDILTPPMFTKSGVVKTREQAWADGDWIATFNLWIARSSPGPAILFQERSIRSSFAPGKLDIAAGGHYTAGEEGLDGLREAEEELGKKYPREDAVFLGKRAYVGVDTKGRMRRNIVYVYCIIDNSSIETFSLDSKEVNGLYIVTIENLIKMYKNHNYIYKVEGIDIEKKAKIIEVTMDSFINADWDNYKYKTIMAIKNLLNGMKEVYI